MTDDARPNRASTSALPTSAGSRVKPAPLGAAALGTTTTTAAAPQQPTPTRRATPRHAGATDIVASDVLDPTRVFAYLARGAHINDPVPFVLGSCVPGAPCRSTCACADNEFARTLLHWAAAYGCSASFLDALVTAGADVTALDRTGQTAFDMAREQGASEDVLGAVALQPAEGPPLASLAPQQ